MVDTLEQIMNTGLGPIPAGSRVVLIGGPDVLRDLPRWHRVERILELADISVSSRIGVRPVSDAELTALFGGRDVPITLLGQTGRKISSTEIRGRIAAGRSIRGLVAPAVERHIRAHRLYSSQA